MAYMVEVFTLTGSEMTDRGNFFATMFVVLAGAALISYGVMGWGTNTVAQVMSTAAHLGPLTDHILGPGSQPSKANFQRHPSSRSRVL